MKKLAALILLILLIAGINVLPQNQVKQITFNSSDSKNVSFYRNDFISPLILYEVHSGNSVNIHSMTYDAQTDTFLSLPPVTNNLFQNINPIGTIINDVSGVKHYVFYQTNQNGNWDLVYSHFTSSGWSDPVELLATPEDEIEPKFLEKGWRYFDGTLHIICRQADKIIFLTFQDSLVSQEEIFSGSQFGDGDSYSGIRFWDDLFYAATTEQTVNGSRLVYKTKNGSSPWSSAVTIADSGHFKRPVWYDPYSIYPYLIFENEINGESDIYIKELNSVNWATIDPELSADKSKLDLATIDIITAGIDFIYAVVVYKVVSNDSIFIRVPWDEMFGYDLLYTKAEDINPAAGFMAYSSRLVYYAIWEDSIDNSVQLFGRRIDVSAGDVNDDLPFYSDYKLHQNYPNPFNPNTSIRYYIPEKSFVSLKIYDMLGREVQTLLHEIQTSGDHEITFNADNLASGIYIYRLNAQGRTFSKKMILIK